MATADEDMEMTEEYWDDDGDQLNFVNVEAEMNRGRRLMNKPEVAEEIFRVAVPSESRICTGGW